MIKKEFVKEAKKIYGNKYDYKTIKDEKLEPYSMIPIICDRHGLFFQTVYDHLDGKGCFECYRNKEKLTDDE